MANKKNNEIAASTIAVILGGIIAILIGSIILLLIEKAKVSSEVIKKDFDISEIKKELQKIESEKNGRENNYITNKGIIFQKDTIIINKEKKIKDIEMQIVEQDSTKKDVSKQIEERDNEKKVLQEYIDNKTKQIKETRMQVVNIPIKINEANQKLQNEIAKNKTSKSEYDTLKSKCK